MYYIEQENDELVKYEVGLDEEKLRQLATEIIDKCSKIEHHITGNYIDPSWIIKNKKSTLLDIIYDNHSPNVEYIYRHEFDRYIQPELYYLIHRLIKGDMTVIDKIKHHQKDEIYDDYDEKLLNLSKDAASKIPKGDISSLNRIKSEIELIKLNKELNKDRQPIDEYYPKVLKCITYKEIARIRIEILEELAKLHQETEPFFATTTLKNINPKVDKELYKRLIIK